jgi:ligand-binding SRPBCC domain-containing protein
MFVFKGTLRESEVIYITSPKEEIWVFFSNPSESKKSLVGPPLENSTREEGERHRKISRMIITG